MKFGHGFGGESGAIPRTFLSAEPSGEGSDGNMDSGSVGTESEVERRTQRPE